MDEVTLHSTTEEGVPLKAVYAPNFGMNLVSYQRGDIEVIDQSTFALFQERFAGLGAFIGPHFHRQQDALIPPNIDEALFPHIAAVKAKGVNDPFSHGIGRYVPWKYKCTHSTIRATLSSEDTYKDVPLKEFEGCNFSMTYEAELTPTGLDIALSVKASRPSIIGLHYYYRMVNTKTTAVAHVAPQYSYQGEWMPIPNEWLKKDHLHFTFDKASDYGFIPPNKQQNLCMNLYTDAYHLQVLYSGDNSQHSCQLFHPQDASYVCVEPLSAHNPRKLTAPESTLNVKLCIEPPTANRS